MNGVEDKVGEGSKEMRRRFQKAEGQTRKGAVKFTFRFVLGSPMYLCQKYVYTVSYNTYIYIHMCMYTYTYIYIYTYTYTYTYMCMYVAM